MHAITYGVSFSAKYCRELKIDPQECFTSLIDDLGITRFRLMSYWDEIEAKQGTFDFDELDWQIAECEKKNVAVTLCLGIRQPRWPECHPPEWAKSLDAQQLEDAILHFNKRVIERYGDKKIIISWQLENEAFNKGIGTCVDYSRKRLFAEYRQITSLNKRPIVMSTSNSFGIPIFGPIPTIVGFSIYRSQYNYEKSEYSFSKTPAIFQRLRSGFIKYILGRHVIVHELQCEPWGPKATVELSDEEQKISMNPQRFHDVIAYTHKTGIPYIDMWGGEWWYWRKVVRDDPAMWNTIKDMLAN
jgi:hypothetical protein